MPILIVENVISETMNDFNASHCFIPAGFI